MSFEISGVTTPRGAKTLSGTGIGRPRHRRSALTKAWMILVRNILSTVQAWRARVRFRRELAARSDRELRDMGTCWASIADEEQAVLARLTGPRPAPAVWMDGRQARR